MKQLIFKAIYLKRSEWLAMLGLVVGISLVMMEPAFAADALDEVGIKLQTTTHKLTNFASQYLAPIIGVLGLLSTGFLLVRDRHGGSWKVSLATTAIATIIIKFAGKLVTGLFGWL